MLLLFALLVLLLLTATRVRRDGGLRGEMYNKAGLGLLCVILEALQIGGFQLVVSLKSEVSVAATVGLVSRYRSRKGHH